MLPQQWTNFLFLYKEEDIEWKKYECLTYNSSSSNSSRSSNNKKNNKLKAQIISSNNKLKLYLTQLGEKTDPLIIEQVIEICTYYQTISVQTRIRLRGRDAWNSQDFWDTTRLSHTRSSDNKKKIKKKGTFRIADFAVPADLRVKIKESEKRESTRTLPEN